jgi:hypothetical protein
MEYTKADGRAGSVFKGYTKPGPGEAGSMEMGMIANQSEEYATSAQQVIKKSVKTTTKTVTSN